MAKQLIIRGDGTKEYVDVPEKTEEELREYWEKNWHWEYTKYIQDRKREYPSIEDQLDALYHAGVFPQEMADKIKAVKDKYPKTPFPEQ